MSRGGGIERQTASACIHQYSDEALGVHCAYSVGYMAMDTILDLDTKEIDKRKRSCRQHLITSCKFERKRGTHL